MATLAQPQLTPGTSDARFFLRGAILMGLLIVIAFSFQFVMGRSTLASPLAVHAHAIVFMGWVGIYLLQSFFAATDRMAFHRPLGWVAAAWVPLMIALGLLVTVNMVRSGYVPFFFQPLHFLVFDPVNVLGFAGLTTAAIALRRRTDWHRRLHFCAMASLLPPAFGRLLPLPLLQPWAWEASFAAALAVAVLAAWLDARRTGRAHPAWTWGIGATLSSLVVVEAITYSPVGLAIYEGVTQGSPGAAVAPLDFAEPPTGPLMTGRT